jgi:biotin carboxyl carrier protein
MKFELKIQAGQQTSVHVLELAAELGVQGTTGSLDVLVDGQLVRADCTATASRRYSVLVEGRSYQARVWKSPTRPHRNSVYVVAVGNRVFEVELQDPRLKRHQPVSAPHNQPEDVLAPMPGKVVKILSVEGARITPGQGLLVIEAMKMQNEVRASRTGCVEKIYVHEGQGVEAGSLLLRMA